MPLQINGVPLGASMAELKSKMPGFECGASSCTLTVAQYLERACGAPPAPESPCASKERERLNVGSVNAIYYEAEFRNDALGRIFIRTGQIGDAMIDALSEKYGKPTSDVSTPFLSKTGPRFTNRTVTWIRADGKMLVKQPYGSLEEAAVIITSKAFEDAAAKDSLERKSAVQGN